MIAALALTLLALPQAGPQDEAQLNEAFADDLAAENGVPVAFVPGSAFGGVAFGYFRVGTSGGPVVIALPEDLEGDDPVARAFGGDVRETCRAITADDALRPMLGEIAILVPVDVAVDDGPGTGSIRPDSNFSVRWQSARALVGHHAGPYPGALARVGRLSDWLLAQRTCAAVVLVGEENEPESRAVRPEERSSDAPFAPGSLAAFCAERLGARVLRCDTSADARGQALRDAVDSFARLELRDVRWQRLGATSWSADVEVVNTGASATSLPLHARVRRPRGVRLGVTVRSSGVLWSASAIGLEERAPMRVVDAGPGGLAIPDLAPGQAVRVRLFFTGAPSGAGETPVVDLQAASARALGASATRLSP